MHLNEPLTSDIYATSFKNTSRTNAELEVRPINKRKGFYF